MEIKTIDVDSRKTWRNWLEKNYDKETKVCIILYKKHTGKPSISHRESMEEAICFGWIDTTLKRLDHDRYMRCFAKRTKNSRWSNNTLSYGEDLIKRGLMTPHGLKMYKEGLSKPTLDAGRPAKLEITKEFQQALDKNKEAKEFLEKLSKSNRNQYLAWVSSAKREETKKDRINKSIKKLKEGKKSPYFSN